MQDVTGMTIKTYREHLQLSQYAFAELLGFSQALISAVELGRTPVSRKLLRQLRIKGDEGGLRPSLADFLGQGGIGNLDEDRGIQVLTPIPLETWSTRINLSKPPDRGAPGRFVVPGAPDDARAILFSPPPAILGADTVAVFRAAELAELAANQVVLVQLARRHGDRTLRAGVAHLGRAIVSRHGRRIVRQFERGDSSAPVVELTDENVEAVMSCFFRGRYCP